MMSKVKDIAARYETLGELLSSPETAADPARWAAYSKERASLEEIALQYYECERTKKEMEAAFSEAEKETGEMKELLLEEGYVLKEKLSTLENELKVLLLPKDEKDDRGCTLEIRAGAGGEEAALFAYELYRMYQGYCEKHRFRFEPVDLSETELGGMKEAIVNISGKGAYGRLKYESGVHRVQRVPETESQGRIHTSTVTVAVLPEAEELEVTLDEKDVRIDLYRSSGAGGQKVNKTETAIRLTHFPTGIVVTCQNERSQLQNKEMAFKYLRSKLIEKQIEERMAAEAALKGETKKIEWGSQIRSYVFCPYTLVKDHRTGYEVGDVQAVMDGEIQGFIIDYLKKS